MIKAKIWREIKEILEKNCKSTFLNTVFLELPNIKELTKFEQLYFLRKFLVERFKVQLKYTKNKEGGFLGDTIFVSTEFFNKNNWLLAIAGEYFHNLAHLRYSEKYFDYFSTLEKDLLWKTVANILEDFRANKEFEKVAQFNIRFLLFCYHFSVFRTLNYKTYSKELNSLFFYFLLDFSGTKISEADEISILNKLLRNEILDKNFLIWLDSLKLKEKTSDLPPDFWARKIDLIFEKITGEKKYKFEHKPIDFKKNTEKFKDFEKTDEQSKNLNALDLNLERSDLVRFVYFENSNFKAYRKDYQTIVESYKTEIFKLRSQLTYRFINVKKTKYGLFAGELDEDELTAFYLGSKNVYKQRFVKKSPGINLVLLVDLSESMREYDIYLQARDMLIILYETVKNLENINLFIFGHSTSSFGDSQTEIYEFLNPYKSKKPPYSLVSISPLRDNRDGMAIWKTAEEVKKYIKEDEAIMVVISDGAPYAKISRRWQGSNFKLLKEGVKQAKNLGFSILHIAVGYQSSLEEFFDKELNLRDFLTVGKFIGQMIKEKLEKN